MCVCLCVCVFLGVCNVCVCCFLGNVWEGVGKSDVRVSGRVSSCHIPLNRESVFFLEGTVSRA